MNSKLLIFFISSVVIYGGLSQRENNASSKSFSDINEKICNEKFVIATKLKLQNAPIGKVIIEVAKSFIGTEYEANTLETQGTEEPLIVNLHKLDCVTFYENSLAIARCIKKNKLTYDNFKEEVQYIRYRDGIINEYPSRLHYTTDFFYNNEKKLTLKDITKDLGGILLNKKINFMSNNKDKYSKLKKNPEFLNEIQKVEKEINSRKIYYIPKAKVKKLSQKIEDGDIIGITTSIDGLDCHHTGIAIKIKNETYIIHASMQDKRVKISDDPLWKYLASNKKSTGIIVARPLEPE